MRIVEFFAGTGSITLAAKNNNFDVVFANDNAPESTKIYNHNFPNNGFVEKDIHELNEEDIPEMDIITAGFPCQPFSVAGQQKGFEDKRSNVFWKLLSIIEYHRPKIVLLENVKNLKTHDKGKTFSIIIENIEKHGYTVIYKVLNSTITGIPHSRERIFILAFRDKELAEKFQWPKSFESLKTLDDLLEKEPVDEKFYYTNSSIIYDKLKEDVVKHSTIYQYRRYYVRENKSGVCPTLTANMGTGGHNVPIILTKDNKIRKLTPKECFNLQGFPESYILPDDLSNAKLYKLAGNAITVKVVDYLFQNIRKALNS